MARVRPRLLRVGLVATAVLAAGIGIAVVLLRQSLRHGDGPGSAGGAAARDDAETQQGPSLAGLTAEQHQAHRQRTVERWQ